MESIEIRSRSWQLAAVLLLAAAAPEPREADGADGTSAPAIGARHDVGSGPSPRRVRHLSITEPGVYEDILVDGEWDGSTLVKVLADGVTLRRCEIRNGR